MLPIIKSSGAFVSAGNTINEGDQKHDPGTNLIASTISHRHPTPVPMIEVKMNEPWLAGNIEER